MHLLTPTPARDDAGFLMPSGPSYLRADALAERWDTSTKTLANWRNRGQGPAYVKIGGAVRYALADVLAFEAAGRVEAVAA